MPDYFTPVLANPYPIETDYEITEFKYESPILLRREIEAVKTRGDADDAEYIVGADYIVSYRLNGGPPRLVTVPKGMLTDLASVPALTRFLVDRVGPHLEASILHDFLYVAWQDVPGLAPRREDQKFADKMLNAGMKEAEVNSFKRFVIYHAVRIFGWLSFKEPNPQRYVHIP
jgi:hypothetical protein